MAKYSVAEAKDGLSALIDKALMGEEVIITRRGKPTVELRTAQPEKRDRRAAMDRLRRFRDAAPALGEPLPLDRFYEWLYEGED